MLDFVMQYANNLTAGLLAVNVPLTLVSAGVALVSWRKRDFTGGGQQYGSDGYANSTWRMWAAAQTTGVAWAAWLVVGAVPSPNYRYKVVEKKVEVTRTLWTTYAQAMRECEELDGGEFTPEDKAFCDVRALALTKPNMRIELTRPVDRFVRVPDPYAALYNRCMTFYSPIGPSGRYTVEENVRERMDKCHRQALEARKTEE